MTELEKMIAGIGFDATDPTLKALRQRALELRMRFNLLSADDDLGRSQILKQLLGAVGESLVIIPPFYVDYGRFISFGDNCFVNMNCTLLDGAPITVGSEVLLAPGVQIYTAFHPTSAAQRFQHRPDHSLSCVDLTAPVTIGDRCWIGGGAIILPGVIIGEDTVVGAGSVVSRSLPAHCIAAGNPCRILRPNQ